MNSIASSEHANRTDPSSSGSGLPSSNLSQQSAARCPRGTRYRLEQYRDRMAQHDCDADRLTGTPRALRLRTIASAFSCPPSTSTGVNPERDLTVTSCLALALYGELHCLALLDDHVEFGIADDAAAFRQRAIDPRIGELTAAHCSDVVRILCLERPQPIQEFDRDLLRDDHDAGLVRDENVSRISDDAAAANRVVDLARATVKRTYRSRAARKDGHVERQNPGKIADFTIHDKASDAPVLRFGRDQITKDCGRRTAPVDNDDVSRLRDVQCLVDHQVVAREDLHGAHRSAQARTSSRQAADFRVDGVQAIELIRDVGCLEVLELLNEHRIRSRESAAYAKTWAGMHFR